MLTLTVKKERYDKLLSGKKKEEYVKIKPSYTKKFLSAGLLTETVDPIFGSVVIEPNNSANWICFKNGYDTEAPSFRALVEVRIGTGNSDWGANPGEQYYILHILSIE